MAVEVLASAKELNCRECDDKLKEERGCEKEGILPFYYREERLFRCPIKLITKASWEYIAAFPLYQKGILPNSEVWREESDKFLEAMAVIENTQNKISNEMMMRKK